ncbi:MAG: sugar phosphate isomerase/epimerase [Peptococcaceae bacterium]|jgi:sugar phosphate isomerase/epimerase|nr:sugar phosphate isomerase/epimerase [Peptococcaceae bacterium]
MPILAQTVPLQFDTVYSPYPAAGWREAFGDVARHGLTGIELAVAYPKEVDGAAVVTEAERRGLTVTTLSTGQICGLDGQFLTALDPGARQRASATVLEHIRLSAKIGRPHVTIGLIRGGFDEDSGTEELLAAALRPLCQAAANEGVSLQIEPINRGEVSLLTNVWQTVAFIRGMGNPPGLGILYDTYHSDLEDGDPLAAARAALPYLTNVHLADRGRLLPGEGGIDFGALSESLLAAGYQGTFALEAKCLPTREHVLARYGESLRAAVAGGDAKRAD